MRRDTKQRDPFPPLDPEAIASQYGWWQAIETGDVRLFAAWIEMHDAVIISSRTIERYAGFFDALPRRRMKVEDHSSGGFVFRRLR